MLGIFTADCVPLLMSGRNGEVKAAIHAGWKGLYLGIIEDAVKILNEKFCINPGEIRVYIGPHIRSCCYEVSYEMGNRFNVKLRDNKLNLSGVVSNKLKTLGVNEVFDINHCTFHETDLFFSYRRSKCSERILSVIC
jgi:YfiH family protein